MLGQPTYKAQNCLKMLKDGANIFYSSIDINQELKEIDVKQNIDLNKFRSVTFV